MNPLAAFSNAAAGATAALKEMTQVVRGWGATNTGAGFSALATAAKMVASVFGTVLLPGMAIAAAGVMTLAEVIFDMVEDAMPAVIDSFVQMAEMTMVAVKGIKFFAESLVDVGGKIGEWIASKIFGAAPPTVGGGASAQNGPLTDPDTGLPVGVNAPAKKKKGVGGSFLENLQGIISEARQGMGQSGFAGIADISKQIQMQSFQSTAESKLFDMMDKSLDWLQKIHDRVRDQNNGLNP